jgi:hypothetical protein
MTAVPPGTHAYDITSILQMLAAIDSEVTNRAAAIGWSSRMGLGKNEMIYGLRREKLGFAS